MRTKNPIPKRLRGAKNKEKLREEFKASAKENYTEWLEEYYETITQRYIAFASQLLSEKEEKEFFYAFNKKRYIQTLVDFIVDENWNNEQKSVDELNAYLRCLETYKWLMGEKYPIIDYESLKKDSNVLRYQSSKNCPEIARIC